MVKRIVDLSLRGVRLSISLNERVSSVRVWVGLATRDLAGFLGEWVCSGSSSIMGGERGGAKSVG